MNTDSKWFVAEALFRATGHTGTGDEAALDENLLFLVQAADLAAAMAKADLIARGKEHSYQNEAGQQVSWTFVRLLEVTEMIDQQLEDGAEIKSVMSDIK